MQAKIYNEKGAETGDLKLPESVFGVAWNSALVSQVVLAIQANMRRGTAHTKDRGEVAGGGRKPWRQKGTGRARHGSIRSPIWIGGGVTFGPRSEKDYSKKINKKMRQKALASVLSKKLKEGEILFMENFSMKEPKTSAGLEVLKALSTKVGGAEGVLSKKNNSALIALVDKDSNVEKSFSNFSNISVTELRNLSAYDTLKYKILILVGGQEAVDILEGRLGKKEVKSTQSPEDRKVSKKVSANQANKTKKTTVKKTAGTTKSK